VKSLQVAVVGIQGVPANYGGFESLVENIIGDNCPKDIHYTIFCSSADMQSNIDSYKGAALKYINIHANGIGSIPYDIVSMCHVLKGYDVILVLGVSGCMFMPILRKITKAKIIVNIDGLEHRRDKWGKTAKWVLRTSEAMAVKYADVIVADNKGIQDYVKETYNKDSALIAYGGDHALRNLPESRVRSILNTYGLIEKKYAISICRIEPENNCHVVLEGFAKSSMPLIFIGNWNHSEYSRALKSKYSNYSNIRIQDAVYDLDILYALRSNAGLYIHGHSAGGTNPSLVEAMHFGIPIVTWNVVYNRETTEGKAYYFSTPEELLDITRRVDLSGNNMQEIAQRRYTWKTISKQYCELFRIK
jgi:glycosyltransferase involved in cell wall biosynthesis